MQPTSSDDGRPPRRNARSLDLDDSPTKAAAWVWHLHASKPDVTTEGRFVSHNRRRSSGGCDRKDSRFRLEVAAALAAAAAATPLPAAEKPYQKQAANVWDCGSKLYDTFELVSFSNRLDRSLLGVPAFQAPNSHHAQSPLHQPSGLLRTSSLPRSMSLQSIKGTTHLNDDKSNEKTSPEVAVIGSSNSHGMRQSSEKASKRSVSAKWWVAKLVKIFKKVATVRNQMRSMGRKEPLIRKQLDPSGNQLKQHKQRLAVQDLEIKRHHQHFHHHCHHHHHYLHHLGSPHQSMEAGLADYKPSITSHGVWNPRAESARFSSETMSKICADKNWV